MFRFINICSHLVLALPEPPLPPALLVAGPEAAARRRYQHLKDGTEGGNEDLKDKIELGIILL